MRPKSQKAQAKEMSPPYVEEVASEALAQPCHSPSHCGFFELTLLELALVRLVQPVELLPLRRVRERRRRKRQGPAHRLS